MRAATRYSPPPRRLGPSVVGSSAAGGRGGAASVTRGSTSESCGSRPPEPRFCPRSAANPGRRVVQARLDIANVQRESMEAWFTIWPSSPTLRRGQYLELAPNSAANACTGRLRSTWHIRLTTAGSRLAARTCRRDAESLKASGSYKAPSCSIDRNGIIAPQFERAGRPRACLTVRPAATR
jgi:hypothetical protein